MKLCSAKHKVVFYAWYFSYSLFVGLGVGLLVGAGFYCMITVIPDFLQRDHNGVASRERLIGIYNDVDLGEDLASIAKKVVDHVDGHDIDVDFHDDGRNTKWRLALPVKLLWDDWALTMCFADEQLEGVHFGTVGAVDVPPDAAPSPKGECTWSPPSRT